MRRRGDDEVAVMAGRLTEAVAVRRRMDGWMQGREEEGARRPSGMDPTKNTLCLSSPSSRPDDMTQFSACLRVRESSPHAHGAPLPSRSPLPFVTPAAAFSLRCAFFACPIIRGAFCKST